MLFTSYSFIAFLCALMLVYWVAPKRWQWGILLIGSYSFYAFSGLENILFILFTTLSSYATAWAIDKNRRAEESFVSLNKETLDKEERKAYKAKEKKKRFNILVVGLVLNFGVLAVIKYTAFAVSNVNSLLTAFGGKAIDIPSLLLPMGISFYIFQTMSYLIDLYRGKAEREANLFKFALFVSFFPQLVQGPISRFSSLGAQLTTPHTFDGKEFTFGLQRVLWGFFKKLVIADRILASMKLLLDAPEKYQGAYVALLILLYSIEIYADFTGGIDITIGISQMLGIKLAENFNRPFSSHSTKEYWNRWHITMGSWFTDYVFYPLSVCRPMLKLSKFSRKTFGNSIGKRIPVYLATIVTWFLTGLWHGAGWNFIVWGLLNCQVILVSQELEPLYARFRKKFPRLTASKPYGNFMAVRTFLLMGLIRSLDCYRNVGLTFRMWGTMFTRFNLGELLSNPTGFGLSVADMIIIALGVCVVFAVSKASAKGSVREKLYAKPALSLALTLSLFVAIILFGAYGIGYDGAQFIYNQF